MKKLHEGCTKTWWQRAYGKIILELFLFVSSFSPFNSCISFTISIGMRATHQELK